MILFVCLLLCFRADTAPQQLLLQLSKVTLLLIINSSLSPFSPKFNFRNCSLLMLSLDKISSEETTRYLTATILVVWFKPKKHYKPFDAFWRRELSKFQDKRSPTEQKMVFFLSVIIFIQNRRRVTSEQVLVVIVVETEVAASC